MNSIKVGINDVSSAVATGNHIAAIHEPNIADRNQHVALQHFRLKETSNHTPEGLVIKLYDRCRFVAKRFGYCSKIKQILQGKHELFYHTKQIDVNCLLNYYMAKFEDAIGFIFKHEGGFAQTAAGEYVNRGINLDTLKQLKYKGTDDELKAYIKGMTQDQAATIYKSQYWGNLDAVTYQNVATKILDAKVLCGPAKAIKLVQRTLGTTETGRLDDATLAALNQYDPQQFVDQFCVVWDTYLAAVADHDVQIAGTPVLATYWSRVKKGWHNRAVDKNFVVVNVKNNG